MVDLTTWQPTRDSLLVREQAHTREGVAIAAARRRLPIATWGPTSRPVPQWTCPGAALGESLGRHGHHF
ncbi:DUF899 family protein [Micromonospora sp. NPDC047738]|uniref:DUF899 family protein n=1 Tax=unclassified Micromonospora TaxID=2617518 RepID=UPI0033E75434